MIEPSSIQEWAAYYKRQAEAETRELTAERDQLRAEAEDIRQQRDYWQEEAVEMRRYKEALEALVAGLRGALEEISEMDWKCAATNAMGYRANKVAASALALTPASAGARLKAEARKDNEELDGTDAAHPAWWRGNDAGVSQVCAQINAILDGADVFGTAAEPWESTRRRVAEARKDSERLDWLEAHPRIIVAATGYRGAKDSWYWRDETDALATHETATLRAAIDSARGAK